VAIMYNTGGCLKVLLKSTRGRQVGGEAADGRSNSGSGQVRLCHDLLLRYRRLHGSVGRESTDAGETETETFLRRGLSSCDRNLKARSRRWRHNPTRLDRTQLAIYGRPME